ncbi:hypothetical protein PR202_gb02612 [Eleusine coracana subsp. coracana]|uniref:BTB domain-containing protein n=1 Tax=Eleusine coracana subsp. coracana TaxID=191504 RepID=A0AAV5DZG7_ELECO|nr:hypothetical protein PR202_gb02612 [Eleusine coracana subsp. coracana]
MVLNDSSNIPVPPSDIGKHIGTLLDSKDGMDVSFAIGDEILFAHRAVLAARSPALREQLLGSTGNATRSPPIAITTHKITPATFRAMLRFIYTDNLPGDNELGHPSTEALHNLLAAADWYALHRLKLLCANKLWNDISVDTVAATLACAKKYNCPELRTSALTSLQ